MESKYCLITTTCNDKQTAEKIAKTLLQKKLISCIQLNNVNSLCHWKGEIEISNEILLQMKSKKSLYKEVEKEILLIHNYQTPQILMYDIVDGYEEYLNWIDRETK